MFDLRFLYMVHHSVKVGILLRSILFVCALLFLTNLAGQIFNYEEQLEHEITKRGIDRAQFDQLLLDAGYDPDRLNEITAEEAADIQSLIRDFERNRFLRERDLLLRDTTRLIDKDIVDTDSLIVAQDSSDISIDSIEEKIFGHRQFRSGQISLVTTNEGYSPPETYILGIGDEIVISIFGTSRVEETQVIRKDGSVRILNGNVKVTLGGLNVQEARIKLERAYRREYRFSPNQFSIFVSSTRHIRITVYGEVIKQGDYTVSAANGITNLLAAAGGFTDHGSVRNIKVVKGSNVTLNFDLYKIMTDPDYLQDFSLDNGDMIIVPAAANVVSIKGAVHRPMNYEIKEGEGLFELIEYAGGLAKGAYLRSIKINRYEFDKRIVKDVAYAELIKKNEDFLLLNGDEVIVKEILEELENYVTVTGEARNEGNFELVEDMSLKEVLQYAGLRSSTKMNIGTLKRINKSGRVTIIPISPEDAINGVGASSLIVMQDRDEVILWAKERFIDNKYINIAGAVRVPDQFDYDDRGALRASDLINIAGGLRSDAAGFAHLHRLDPLNPNNRQYIRLDLARLTQDPSAADNIFLEPYDSLYVYSENEFQENIFIKVSGAVNSPGQFIYGEGMTLKDAILFANGFKGSSATNRIEISRVIIEDNRPTKTIIKQVALGRQDLSSQTGNDFKLEPFDNIFVRYVPNFELQQNVFIKGEVTLPGEYSLVKNNETVYDIVQRAGGVTEEAFPGAATLYRSQDSLGYMVIKLDDVLRNPSSTFNLALTDGDTLYIPKLYNHVVIRGATQFLQQSNQKQIVVPYEEGKNALYYINNYAGGFADNARKDKIFVTYPNMEVKMVKKRLFGRKYPRVLPGSEISVWTVKKDLRAEREKEDVNWTKVLGDSVAQAMSILTLIFLAQR